MIAFLIEINLAKPCSLHDPLGFNNQFVENINVATSFCCWHYHDSWLLICTKLLVRLIVMFFCFELESSCRKFRKFCFFISNTNFFRSFIKTMCKNSTAERDLQMLGMLRLCLSVSISLLVAPIN